MAADCPPMRVRYLRSHPTGRYGCWRRIWTLWHSRVRCSPICTISVGALGRRSNGSASCQARTSSSYLFNISRSMLCWWMCLPKCWRTTWTLWCARRPVGRPGCRKGSATACRAFDAADTSPVQQYNSAT